MKNTIIYFIGSKALMNGSSYLYEISIDRKNCASHTLVTFNVIRRLMLQSVSNKNFQYLSHYFSHYALSISILQITSSLHITQESIVIYILLCIAQ